jgi:hypothetical protein
MGRSILIIIFGLSLILAFIVLKMNTNATNGVESTMNKFDQTHARLISNSGIEIYLEKLKWNRSLMNSTHLGNHLFDGTYDIWISGPDELVRVKSTATFMGVQHTSIAEARADRIKFNPGRAALHLSASSVQGLKKKPLNGNLIIDGHDHYETSPYDTIPGAQSMPGIGVPDSTLIPEVIDLIQKTKTFTGHVAGSGSEPSVDVVTDTVNWAAYADTLLSGLVNKPITKSTKKSDINWGTLADPQLNFIHVNTGDVFDINNSIGSSGCGILIIDGSVTFSGNFTYTGLVIAYQNTDLTLGGSGTVTIVGSLVGAGSTVYLTVTGGTLNILYSSPALSLVENLILTKRFEILSWWE